MALAQIKLGLKSSLLLGNLYAKRDWGHAKDYVRAMWLMMQQKTPKDYVIATGHQYSVKDFINACCRELGLALIWKGEGLEEKGYIDGKAMIAIDPAYFRPTEVETLLGDAANAKKDLGWEPEYSFDDLVSDMVAHDLQLLKS